MTALRYIRHFVLIGCAALFLAAISLSDATRPIGPFQGFIYGILHGASVVGSLRHGVSRRLKVVFVCGAGILALFVPYAALLTGGTISWFTGPLFHKAPISIWLLGSAIGALSYAWWIRRVLRVSLSWPGFVLIAVACMAATSVGTTLDPPNWHEEYWLTVLWWSAFSFSLWYAERLSVTPNNSFERTRDR